MTEPDGDTLDGPLSGVRILDLTTIILGPFATQILADQGADVIKIEPPEGDGVRHVGPPPGNGRASVFLGSNRNKRSLVLDLKQASARDALAQLATQADVFVHNMRPRAAERLGINYASAAQWNPDIIYCGAYGFRRGGPYADKPAYDDMIQAASGLAMLQGGDEPRYVTSAIADKITSQTVAQAITAALFRRERDGRGQEVEVTMFETMVAFNAVEHLYGLSYVPKRTAAGYPRTLSAHRRPYRTRDGFIGVLPYSDRQWQSLFTIAGVPELGADSRFKDLASRLANIDALYEILGELLAARTTAEWLDELDASNVPAMAVLSLDQLIDDPHLDAVGFWQYFDDPELGRLRTPGVAPRFSRTPGRVQRLPPHLGQHSVEVLTEFGIDRARIEQLIASGATVDGSET